jgi:GntR family transcriptional regulator / MocR family aminotransferase
MELHVSLIGRTNVTREIYRQIRRVILDGQLRPGDLLPPSRVLARGLGVSRTTVAVAYDRLSSEGFVTARVGAGTFVSEQVARAPGEASQQRVVDNLLPRPMWESIPVPTVFDRPARFDFRPGLPDASLFPYQTWRRLMGRQLRSEAVGTGAYGHPAGHRGLRESIARHIGISRGVACSADDVSVTNGTQQALDVVARAFLAPGDGVAVEDPCYSPARWLFQTLGAHVVGVPVDRDGLIVDALPHQARLVYVTPSHQFPLGMSMSLSRRLALLAWAERNNAAIVEDDYDSEFRFGGRPIEPLHTLDTAGRVVYVGSFSKTLLPTLRLGFLVTPPSLSAAVHKAKFVADWHTGLPVQAALARFIEDGSFARHIRKVGAVYRVRHARIVDVVARDFADHLEVIPSAVGLHVAVLARSRSAEQIDAVIRRAADAGVELLALSRFAVDRPPPAGLLVGYGAIPTTRLEEGLLRLRSCFDG